MVPLVSILIPAYNAEHWIAETIRSACAQTWSRKEVIVVDDGSSDRTLEVARSLQSGMVKVLQQPNSGASAARNHALKHAQGDFIQWLDADDILAADKVEVHLRQGGLMDSPRTLSSSAWARFFSVPEKGDFKQDALWEDLTPAEWLLRKLDLNLWMAINAWLVSRELTEAAGGWNTALSRDDDGDYFCRVLSHSERVTFVPEAKSFVRRSSNASMSHDRSLSRQKLESLAVSFSTHVRCMLALDSSARARAACVRFLQRWFIYFYPEHPDLIQKLQDLAAECGQPLISPSLSWKYRWIQMAFGWNAAKFMMFRGPKLQGYFSRAREELRASSSCN